MAQRIRSQHIALQMIDVHTRANKATPCQRKSSSTPSEPRQIGDGTIAFLYMLQSIFMLL